MEVFVSNVPIRASRTALKRFIKPILHDLGISSFDVFKGPRANWAKLVFLYAIEANYFLSRYGQPAKRQRGPAPSAKLFFHNQPIYCKPSTGTVDQYTIKALQRAEKDRKARVEAEKTRPKESPVAQHAFALATIDCGQFFYVEKTLAFRSDFRLVSRGQLKFGQKGIHIITGEGHRIDFGEHRRPPFLYLFAQ